MALDTFNPYLFVSAGEQSNKFLTPTYSGVIASFQAQRAQQLTKLLVQIDPVQSGSGDPSPSNIRPISGRTGLTATRCGKNLLDWNAFYNSYPHSRCTAAMQSDGSVLITSTATAGAVWIGVATSVGNKIPSGAWRLPVRQGDSFVASGKVAGSTIFYEIAEDGTVLSTATGATFTVNNSECKSLAIRVSYGDASTFGETLVDCPMLRYAAITNSTYEPYHGTTYPISWQTEAGTVYGGTLDVVSGVLTVDSDYIASYNGETLPGEWISDRDVYAEGTTPTTGAEVAYKLAEPVTYQLDPEQVMTLSGFNQIYSDAGPVIDIKF